MTYLEQIEAVEASETIFELLAALRAMDSLESINRYGYIPTWTERPQHTTNLYSWSENFVITQDLELLARAYYDHDCPKCGKECYAAENDDGQILVGDQLYDAYTDGYTAAVRDENDAPLCVDCYE